MHWYVCAYVHKYVATELLCYAFMHCTVLYSYMYLTYKGQKLMLIVFTVFRLNRMNVFQQML